MRGTVPTLGCAVLLGTAACTGASRKAADTPIDVESLTGRIVVTGEEDVYSANADGTGLQRLITAPGPEMEPAWAPDGSRVVYRDSRRGITVDDEIFVVDADSTDATNRTNHPPTTGGPTGPPTAAASSSTPTATRSP